MYMEHLPCCSMRCLYIPYTSSYPAPSFRMFHNTTPKARQPASSSSPQHSPKYLEYTKNIVSGWYFENGNVSLTVTLSQSFFSITITSFLPGPFSSLRDWGITMVLPFFSPRAFKSKPLSSSNTTAKSMPLRSVAMSVGFVIVMLLLTWANMYQFLPSST